MALEMRLDMKLAQKLVMTPQLQQAIKLLQLSRMELSQLVYQEMLENPILEDVALDAPSEPEDSETQAKDEAPLEDGKDEDHAIDVFDMRWDNYIEEDEARMEPGYYPDSADEMPSYDQTLSTPMGLSEHLVWQFRLTGASNSELAAGEVIIGNIDEDGYLRDFTLEEVAKAADVSVAAAKRALAIVQDLDPPGVAARDLKECLLIQARQMGLSGTIVEEIILHHMDELEKKRYPAMARTLKVSVKDILMAEAAIEALEPKPGRPFTSSEVQYIVPDVYVVKKGDDYVILLNDEGLPKLRISPFYKNLMRGGGDTSTKDYIENKLRSAQWLIKSIEQRNKTVYRVTESIVKRQRNFFDRGIEHIRPMVLRDVAEDIGMHESTISRVTTNKYMHSPQGIYELKYFFSGGIASDDGEALSSITVRGLIQKAISDEDPKKPLNDRKIVDILKKKNILIARRTVAKYRCELKIPPANLRKKPY